VSKLIRIPGIVIKASTVKVKATQLRIQCQKCHSVKDVVLRPGMSGVNLPRTCDRPPMENEEKCPLDPYQIVGEKSLYVNQQTLKLQESPDLVPQGELPRHVQVSADRYLTRRIAPGSRVTVVGVYEIIKHRPRVCTAHAQAAGQAGRHALTAN
jgi:DNA replication licensing factor MCM5